MDFNDSPSGMNIPWKPIAIGASALIIVVLVVVVISRMIGGGDEVLLVANETVNVEELTDRQITNIAETQLSSEVCDLLEGNGERDNCYWTVARKTVNPAFCQGMRTNSDGCSDSVNLALALETGDWSYCAQILDSRKRSQCAQLFSGSGNYSTCEPGSQKCVELQLTKQAAINGDSGTCGSIEDPSFYDECLFNAKNSKKASTSSEPDPNADDDNDGLTTAQEEQYGSDPANPDSDGDGYSDGDEVSAGYSPIGPGVLQ